uniref:Secreted protein n=1 Tax=Ascaris lumbricoides TaxID=6252 RepID=A0A0M3HZI2_ASCLU
MVLALCDSCNVGLLIWTIRFVKVYATSGNALDDFNPIREICAAKRPWITWLCPSTGSWGPRQRKVVQATSAQTTTPLMGRSLDLERR